MNRYRLWIITIFVILFMPFSLVAAETYTYSSKENGSIEDFYIDSLKIYTIRWTKYYRYKNTNKPGAHLDFLISNEYSRDIRFLATVRLYDKNDKELDSFEKEFNILALSKDEYEQDVVETDTYTLADVSYYSLEIDMITNLAVTRTEKDYYVDEYMIHVDVNENNTFDVRNTFRAIFKNGTTEVVELGIPNRMQYIRYDGGRVNKRAVIKDIYIPDYYTLETNEGIRELSIGKQNLEYSTKYYDLSYQYNVGRDTRKDNDEFVFYLTNGLDANIDGIRFEIVMPKEFDESDIHFIDRDGIAVDNVVYEIKDNIIRGKINGTIEQSNSYLIYVLLPDGYFRNTVSTIGTSTILSFVLPILFLIITILFWFLYRKSFEKGTFKGFYFNKNLNSLEVGYLFNGKVKEHDIATLIIYMATKGYLKIKKEGKSYKIIKIKDYDGEDRVEKYFMKELFYDNSIVERKDLPVNLDDISNIMNQKLSEDKRKKKLYVTPFFNYKILFYIMMAVIFVINTYNVIIDYQPSVIWVNIIFSGIGYILLLANLSHGRSRMERILFILSSIIFIIVPILLSSYKAFIFDLINLIIYFVSILCMVIIAVIVSMMSNRTGYGRRMYKKILGYKEYLINATETAIDEEMKINKELVYDVLPYTFVLGMSDKWIEKFKFYTLKCPKWYECDKFDLMIFYKEIKNIYSDLFIAIRSNMNKKR